MTRNQKSALFLALAVVGSFGVGLSAIPVAGRVHGAAPDMARIIAVTLVVAFAMAWACFFAVRAHFSQDEFQRQREISASYWGGWLGIAVSAPIFAFIAFIAIGGFGPLAAMHAPPLYLFMLGYLLPTMFAAIGAVGTRFWLHRRDS